MKRVHMGIVLGTILLTANASAAVDTIWLRKFWGKDSAPPFIFNQVADMCTDARGYVYICGAGEFPNPSSHQNMLIAKYTPWGDTVWMRAVDGNTYSPEDIAHAIAVDSVGNVYFAGKTRNRYTVGTDTIDSEDITWGKYDSSGRPISINKLRAGYPEDDCAYDLVIGKQGDVYLCGTVWVDTAGFAGNAFFVMRTRTDSMLPAWIRKYILDTLYAGANRRDRHPDFVLMEDFYDWENCATAMDVGPDSCLVVTGYGSHRLRELEMWTMKFHDSTRLWEHQYYYPGSQDRDDVAFDVVVANSGLIYVVGISDPTDDGFDINTLRYQPTGGTPATVQLNGSGRGDDFPCAICLDDSSPQNVYVTGYQWVAANNYQAFVQKYTYNLGARWGGAGVLYGEGGRVDDYGLDLAYCRGMVYMTGIAGSRRMFVAAFRCDNTNPHDTLWTYLWAGPFDNLTMGASIAVRDSDHVYVGGEYYRPYVAGYVRDLFLTRLGHPFPDMACRDVLVPLDTTALGARVTPRVRFVNTGNLQATFRAFLYIGSDYGDTVVYNQPLGPGDSVVLSFDEWTAATPGWVPVRCTVAMNGDRQPSNNLLVDSTFVLLRDVACLRIVAPSGVADSGDVIQPRAWLRNCGNARERFRAVMRIAPDYLDTAIADIGPGDSVLCSASSWTARLRGTWPVVCSTHLAGDVHPGNDRQETTVDVRVVDMAILDILSPAGRVDSGTTVTPVIRVINRGSAQTSAWFFCRLDDGSDALVYFDSLQATVDPGTEETLEFAEFGSLTRVGVWVALSDVRAVGDKHPENDTCRRSFRVIPAGMSWPPGWVEVEPLPAAPSGKAVKDGGWLAIDPSADIIYCGKGYKTGDFYSRPVLGHVWTTLTSIPNGLEAKPPYKGAQGICDGDGGVYATKGNNTTGFWRYDIGTMTWSQLPAVPLGVSGKKVKGGTDMVYVVENDTGYVYLLKGYKTDFFRFNTVTSVWDTSLPEAPVGKRAKWDRGSFLVYDGRSTIYAHKAKYHELWSFDLTTHTWATTPLPGMPLVGMLGKSKKSKDGGCGAWYEGAIYALKGGNTQEFWRFSTNSGNWTELETIPSYGSTGKRKRVKAGGDIVYSTYAFWALKGNKTLEFWRYGLVIASPGAGPPRRSGISTGGMFPTVQTGFSLEPNPALNHICHLRYTLAEPVSVRARLFDAAGRLVRVFVWGRGLSGDGYVRLDLSGLGSGVYLFKLETEAGVLSYATKLVLR